MLAQCHIYIGSCALGPDDEPGVPDSPFQAGAGGAPRGARCRGSLGAGVPCGSQPPAPRGHDLEAGRELGSGRRPTGSGRASGAGRRSVPTRRVRSANSPWPMGTRTGCLPALGPVPLAARTQGAVDRVPGRAMAGFPEIDHERARPSSRHRSGTPAVGVLDTTTENRVLRRILPVTKAQEMPGLNSLWQNPRGVRRAMHPA